jgi:hypothetical protein
MIGKRRQWQKVKEVRLSSVITVGCREDCRINCEDQCNRPALDTESRTERRFAAYKDAALECGGPFETSRDAVLVALAGQARRE